MRLANIAMHNCGVDASAGVGYDAAVCEVVLECPVVGEEETGTADLGQGEDVLVIGTADLPGAYGFGFGINPVVVNLTRPVPCQSGSQPPIKIRIAIQLAQQLTANDQPATTVA